MAPLKERQDSTT